MIQSGWHLPDSGEFYGTLSHVLVSRMNKSDNCAPFEQPKVSCHYH